MTKTRWYGYFLSEISQSKSIHKSGPDVKCIYSFQEEFSLIILQESVEKSLTMMIFRWKWGRWQLWARIVAMGIISCAHWYEANCVFSTRHCSGTANNEWNWIKCMLHKQWSLRWGSWLCTNRRLARLTDRYLARHQTHRQALPDRSVFKQIDAIHSWYKLNWIWIEFPNQWTEYDSDL